MNGRRGMRANVPIVVDDKEPSRAAGNPREVLLGKLRRRRELRCQPDVLRVRLQLSNIE